MREKTNTSHESSRWQTTSTQIVHENPWFTVRRDGVTFPDGSNGAYYVVERPTSVCVVPITTENRVVITRSYRYTLNRWCWELPAGIVEPNEDAIDAARRELLEEVGGRAVRFERIGQTFIANGFARCELIVVLARGVTLAAPPQREPGEDIDTVEVVAFDEARSRLLSPGQDGDSALSLLLAAHSIKRDAR